MGSFREMRLLILTVEPALFTSGIMVKLWTAFLTIDARKKKWTIPERKRKGLMVLGVRCTSFFNSQVN